MELEDGLADGGEGDRGDGPQVFGLSSWVDSGIIY